MSDSEKKPVPDNAEFNAFFPSTFSLGQFTSGKTDLADYKYSDSYKGKKWKVLVLGADERYLPMENGTLFSTGNHPVETLLPMIHIHEAGFGIDIATLTGNPMKFEFWAMPKEDETVQKFFEEYLPKFQNPLNLSSLIDQNDLDQYIGVFIPGGHGALNKLPESESVGKLLTWATQNDRFIISICHGPAAFLAAKKVLDGYKIVCFPDSIDKTLPDIGYAPGNLKWLMGEKLRKEGIEIQNEGIDGSVLADRKLITGDSPYAANSLGKKAAEALLEFTSKEA